MTTASPTPPSEVLRAWGLTAAAVQPIEVGNINRTFGVTDPTTGRRTILQWVNPIFPPEVQHDIDAITRHLEAKGMVTPRLVRTLDGRTWTTDRAGGVWRMQTFIEGANTSQVQSPTMARAAGALLGRFHHALADLEYELQSRRAGVHDTPRHAAHLRSVLVAHQGHPAHARAGALAQRILSGLDALPPLGALPARLVHGDPKINNLIFDHEGRGLCMIDLDTVARMPIPIELGDAFRSWCNPLGEDAADPEFDLAAFEAGLEGYAAHAGTLLTEPERTAIPAGVETIALELAARFCADVVEERYFGWNRDRFGAAWEHHLLRAEGQLRLAESFARQRDAAAAIVARSFG